MGKGPSGGRKGDIRPRGEQAIPPPQDGKLGHRKTQVGVNIIAAGFVWANLIAGLSIQKFEIFSGIWVFLMVLMGKPRDSCLKRFLPPYFPPCFPAEKRALCFEFFEKFFGRTSPRLSFPLRPLPNPTNLLLFCLEDGVGTFPRLFLLLKRIHFRFCFPLFVVVNLDTLFILIHLGFRGSPPPPALKRVGGGLFAHKERFPPRNLDLKKFRRCQKQTT